VISNPILPGWYATSLISCVLWLKLHWLASHQYFICLAGYKWAGALFYATLHSVSTHTLTCAACKKDHSTASLIDLLSIISIPPIFWSNIQMVAGSFVVIGWPHVFVFFLESVVVCRCSSITSADTLSCWCPLLLMLSGSACGVKSVTWGFHCEISGVVRIVGGQSDHCLSFLGFLLFLVFVGLLLLFAGWLFYIVSDTLFFLFFPWWCHLLVTLGKAWGLALGFCWLIYGCQFSASEARVL